MPKDGIQEYARALTYRGILHIVHKDLERENDGAGMISLRNVNILDFWNCRHDNYLILGHQLLACTFILMFLTYTERNF